MGESINTIGSRQRTERKSGRLEGRIINGPTTVADLDSRKFKSAITRAHNYTDDNFHQVASATAAKAFGYTDLEKGFRDIEKDHERAGSLTPALQERVRTLEDEIEARIRRDYGEKGIRAWNRAKS